MDTQRTEEGPLALISCPGCGAKNRVPADRMGSPTARCGRCRAPLFGEKGGASEAGAETAYTLRCPDCGAKNRIPAAKMQAPSRCGRCAAPLPTAELGIAHAVPVGDADFESRILKAPLPVLLFAWAPWCPSCRAAEPQIERLAARLRGRLRVAKVNVEANPQIASRLGVLSVPFLFVFDRGGLRESIPGVPPEEELGVRLAGYLA